MTISTFRRIALFAATIAIPGTALAGYPAARGDGRTARSSIKANQARRGFKGKLKVTFIRDSRSGKSAQVAVENGKGKVETFNVDKATGVARRTNTGLMTQSTGKGKANRTFHKERNRAYDGRGKGEFAGAKAQGLSSTGTLKYGSKTDRTEKAYFSMKSGKRTRKTR
jgi:hypothetical protein